MHFKLLILPLLGLVPSLSAAHPVSWVGGDVDAVEAVKEMRVRSVERPTHLLPRQNNQAASAVFTYDDGETTSTGTVQLTINKDTNDATSSTPNAAVETIFKFDDPLGPENMMTVDVQLNWPLDANGDVVVKGDFALYNNWQVADTSLYFAYADRRDILQYVSMQVNLLG